MRDRCARMRRTKGIKMILVRCERTRKTLSGTKIPSAPPGARRRYRGYVFIAPGADWFREPRQKPIAGYHVHNVSYTYDAPDTSILLWSKKGNFVATAASLSARSDELLPLGVQMMIISGHCPRTCRPSVSANQTRRACLKLSSTKSASYIYSMWVSSVNTYLNIEKREHALFT